MNAAHLFITGVIGVCGQGAHAQLLDLDLNSAPDVLDASTELAGDLDARRDAIDPASAIDEQQQAAREFRRAWLGLARECAITGSRAGDAGSGLVVLARTMAKLDADAESDALRRSDPSGIAPIDRVLIQAAADDLQRAARSLSGDDPRASHRAVLRALRATMTPVLGRASSSEAHAAFDAGSLPQDAITDEARARLDELLTSIGTGKQWDALAPASARLERAIASALPREPARPNDRAMHERLNSEFSEALLMREPEAMLESLSAIGEASSFVPRLREIGGNENNRLADRVSKAIAERDDPPSRSITSTRLAGELVTLLESRSALPAERDLIQEVTAAYRALVRELRPIEIESRDAIERLVRDPSGATDPATLATLRAHRRAIETLHGLARLSSFLTQGQRMVAIEYDSAAKRVQAIGRDLITGQSNDPTAAARAVELLRQLISDTDDLTTLSADTGAALGMMPERAQSIRFRLVELPRKVMTAWGVAGGNGPGIELRQEMDVLFAAVRLGADAAASRDRTLDAWHAWELSADTRAVMRDGIEGALDEALRRAVNSSRYDKRALDQVLATRERFGVVYLEGRLLRASGTPRPHADPLHEISLGPAHPDAWMIEHAGSIASICRYAEEWAGVIGSDEDAEGELRRYVARRASELLDTLRD